MRSWSSYGAPDPEKCRIAYKQFLYCRQIREPRVRIGVVRNASFLIRRASFFVELFCKKQSLQLSKFYLDISLDCNAVNQERHPSAHISQAELSQWKQLESLEAWCYWSKYSFVMYSLINGTSERILRRIKRKTFERGTNLVHLSL